MLCSVTVSGSWMAPIIENANAQGGSWRRCCAKGKRHVILALQENAQVLRKQRGYLIQTVERVEVFRHSIHKLNSIPMPTQAI